MKKTMFFVAVMIFMFSSSVVFAVKSDPSDNSTTRKENKLSEEELNSLTKRVEEIRDMDKSNLTLKEKRELRKELKGIKEVVNTNDGYIYIGATTILIIILILILL